MAVGFCSTRPSDTRVTPFMEICGSVDDVIETWWSFFVMKIEGDEANVGYVNFAAHRVAVEAVSELQAGLTGPECEHLVDVVAGALVRRWSFGPWSTDG